MLNIAVKLGRAGKTAQLIWFQLNISLHFWTIFLYFIFICKSSWGNLGLRKLTHTHTHNIHIEWVEDIKLSSYFILLIYFTHALTCSAISCRALSHALAAAGAVTHLLKWVTARHTRSLEFPIPWGKSKWIYAFGPCLIMLSEIHWWWLFIVNRHALNPEWTYSRLINPTLITRGLFQVAGLTYSEFNPALWVGWLRVQGWKKQLWVFGFRTGDQRWLNQLGVCSRWVEGVPVDYKEPASMDLW